ncbi:transposable element Tcb2 transposase [Trichonephila clavipes]|nr:transposable element Tcb2 transposase [Trichonephila clavipes]
MAAQWYVHDILQPHVLPLMQRLRGAIFQQKKCSTSHGKGVTRLSPQCCDPSWPPRSPDLYPIEHIWDNLGWRVGHPTRLNELETRLQQL